MPLESLDNEQINIHDLTLEQEKKPITESERLYNNLKNSAFYDPTQKQWISEISKEQTVIIPNRDSMDQLLAISVEARIDKNQALKSLKYNEETSGLYDSATGKWARGITSGTLLADSWTENQLIAVYAMHLLDPARAQSFYNSLKDQTTDSLSGPNWQKHYDQEDGHWKFSDITIAKVLLGILVDSLYDKDKAFVQYNNYKNIMFRGGKWGDRPLCSDQLIGVLVEAQFDKKKAKEFYFKLKSTKLYDEENEQWNSLYEYAANSLVTDRLSEDQLLGILCEQEFEEPVLNLQRLTPDLPETRKY